MGRLRAGAARTVITPPLGAQIAGYFEERVARDVHDDLHASAVVLESEDSSLAIVGCDLISLDLADTDRAKALAQELTDIPASNILIYATHTHFGPTTSRGVNFIGPEAAGRAQDDSRHMDYMDWVPGRIADSVKMAQNRLRPALLAHASGRAEEGYNRRYLMKDGSVVTNPGYLNPEVVKPAGPTDPEVGVLAIVDEEWRPIAALANYSLHYVGGTAAVDTSITADYFGAFGRALQRMAGSEFVAMLMNGCCGDINNIDVFRPAPDYLDPWYQINRVAEVVAASAYQAWRGVRPGEYERWPRLSAASERFMFRRREFSREQVEAAGQQLKGHAPRNLGDREWLEAHTIVELSKQPLEQETQIQAMRIGDLGLVGLPGEIFVEIGLEIKQRSPFRRTMVGELANDSLGYIPTSKAFSDGSYEVYTTAASPSTGPAMVESAVRLLNQLAG
jgi:hypothetical protein